MHPIYKRYYSDLSHNYLIGTPTSEQHKLADVYLRAADKLITGMKAGATIGKVWNTVNDEVAALVINVPDVGCMRLECFVRVTQSGGEMLTNTPLEWTVLPDRAWQGDSPHSLREPRIRERKSVAVPDYLKKDPGGRVGLKTEIALFLPFAPSTSQRA